MSLFAVAKSGYCQSGFVHSAAFYLPRILYTFYGLQEECCQAHAVLH